MLSGKTSARSTDVKVKGHTMNAKTDVGNPSSGNSTRGADHKGSTRLSVNINARTASELRRLAQEQGITYTEAVRRAVDVLAFMTDEREAGNVIQVVDPHGKTTREIVTL